MFTLKPKLSKCVRPSTRCDLSIFRWDLEGQTLLAKEEGSRRFSTISFLCLSVKVTVEVRVLCMQRSLFPTSCECSYLWVTFLFISSSFSSSSSLLRVPLSVPLPPPYLSFLLLPSLLLLSSPCFPGARGRCSRGSGSSSDSSELDDEPPCMEEIDYNTDSSSDQEGSCSELDRQIQEWAFHKDEGEEEEEGPGQGGRVSP